jgi:hypothetical protein
VWGEGFLRGSKVTYSTILYIGGYMTILGIIGYRTTSGAKKKFLLSEVTTQRSRDYKASKKIRATKQHEDSDYKAS